MDQHTHAQRKVNSERTGILLRCARGRFFGENCGNHRVQSRRRRRHWRLPVPTNTNEFRGGSRSPPSCLITEDAFFLNQATRPIINKRKKGKPISQSAAKFSSLCLCTAGVKDSLAAADDFRLRDATSLHREERKEEERCIHCILNDLRRTLSHSRHHGR